MKNKSHKIFKRRSKKKTIKTQNDLKDHKTISQLNEEKTSTSIIFHSDFVNQPQIFKNMKEFNEQMAFLRNYFQHIFLDFNFNNQEKNVLKQFLHKISSKSPITLEMLLSDKQSQFLSNRSQIKSLYQYLKILNYQLANKQKKIIITKDHTTFKLTQSFYRESTTQSFQGRFISQLQRQIHQNRPNFIEKIKISQQKYKNPRSELSQTTQEMLFLGSVYKKNTQEIKKLSEKLYHKLENKFPPPKNTAQKIYYQVVMKKNIAYAFKQHQIDIFNYFKGKQFEERNNGDAFQKISNQQQFKYYLKNKKQKKGKLSRHGLATACSCCFSDYYELSNPFLTCQNCNLRCHKYCLNLKQNSCGNCSYQRISKVNKQKVDFCFICKQKGLMTYKFDQLKYAHPFCSMIHDLWYVGYKECQQKVFFTKQVKLQNKLQTSLSINYSNGQIQNQNNCLIYGQNLLSYHDQNLSFMDDQNKSSNQFLQQRGKQNNLIIQNNQAKPNQNRFYQEKQSFQKEGQYQLIFVSNLSTQNLDVKDKQISFVKPPKTSTKATLQEQIQIFDRKNPKNQFNISKEKIHSFMDQQQSCQKLGRCCQICQSQFCQKLFVQCITCKNKYHAFCAFFQGFKFQVIQKQLQASCKVNILFNCCTISNIEKENLKRKREFVLNKNRFLFQNL